jgi:hypothetical protein
LKFARSPIQRAGELQIQHTSLSACQSHTQSASLGVAAACRLPPAALAAEAGFGGYLVLISPFMFRNALNA